MSSSSSHSTDDNIDNISSGLNLAIDDINYNMSSTLSSTIYVSIHNMSFDSIPEIDDRL